MKMVRGDSARWTFVRKDADGEIITQQPYAIFLTIKKSFADRDFILQKRLGKGITLSDGVYTVALAPGDTEQLDYGKYVFDIEVIQDAEATYKRTIKRGQFILEGESTWAVNEANEESE